MNYLAHAACVGLHPEWTAGAFLGDHVRGASWARYAPRVAASIRLHRHLDSFVDGMREVRDGRAAFGPDRRYAGILLDMGFDHLLARDWHLRAPTALSLEAFSRHCHESLAQHARPMPESLRRFARYARSERLLENYGDPDTLDRALRGIGTRLSRPGPLALGMDALAPHLRHIEPLFAAVWPRILDFAAGERDRLERAHAQR